MIEYTVKVFKSGYTEWYLNGKLHREDGPAIEHTDGDKEWWLDGRRHREDGPAVINTDGNKLWYFNDKLHREDGPAIVHPDGHKEYWIHHKLHRIGGPAVINTDGTKEWYLNGKRVTPGQSGQYFICGSSEERDEYDLPEIIMVCPAIGVNITQIYIKQDKAIRTGQ